MARKGLLIPRKIYNDMGKILFDAGLIPIIPEMKYTTNRETAGYLLIDDNKYTVYINKRYAPEVIADFNNYPEWSFKAIYGLIDTCSHELFHLIDEKHDVKHKKLTQKGVKLFLRKMNISNKEDILQYIKDCKKDY